MDRIPARGRARFWHGTPVSNPYLEVGCMRARVTMVLALLAIAALAVSPAAAQSPRWLIEGRAGISAVTGGFGDSHKTGYDLGAGAGYRLPGPWGGPLNHHLFPNHPH